MWFMNTGMPDCYEQWRFWLLHALLEEEERWRMAELEEEVKHHERVLRAIADIVRPKEDGIMEVGGRKLVKKGVFIDGHNLAEVVTSFMGPKMIII